MRKLYHSPKVGISVITGHKKVTASLIVLLFFLIYLGPLLPYLWKTLSFTKEFVAPTTTIRATDGRTNVLILGVDSRNGNNPSGLTDTILFTSFDPRDNKALMLSLPRDLWITEMQAKINSAYSYGNLQDGVGIDWAKKYVEEITGQPVHYTVVVSFDGFTKLIDLLGGVEINVENSFVDERYPIAGRENDLCNGDPQTLCRYETLIFNKGLQHMDGTTALKFARSRHAQGVEGSDFARSQRQQKIILAVREKIFSTNVLLNPKKASQILETISGLIETDVPESNFAGLAKLALSARSSQVKSDLIDYSVDKPTFLINPAPSPQYQNQYLLLPKDSSWGEIHNWVNCLLTQDNCDVTNFTTSVTTNPSPVLKK